MFYINPSYSLVLLSNFTCQKINNELIMSKKLLITILKNYCFFCENLHAYKRYKIRHVLHNHESDLYFILFFCIERFANLYQFPICFIMKTNYSACDKT